MQEADWGAFPLITEVQSSARMRVASGPPWLHNILCSLRALQVFEPLFLHHNELHLAADTRVPELNMWGLVLSQTKGCAACWTLSFEVACNFLHEWSRDADISLPAGCNNQVLDEPEGVGTDKGIGLRGNVAFIPSFLGSKGGSSELKLLVPIMV